LPKLLCIESIFGHISIYKGGAVEIFKNIGDEYDNLLININIYVNLRSLEPRTVTSKPPSTDIE